MGLLRLLLSMGKMGGGDDSDGMVRRRSVFACKSSEDFLLRSSYHFWLNSAVRGVGDFRI